VDDRERAVAGRPYVEFDAVGPERHRRREGGERILRFLPARATVSDHGRAHLTLRVSER
jgi:hypothetical protein